MIFCNDDCFGSKKWHTYILFLFFFQQTGKNIFTIFKQLYVFFGVFFTESRDPEGVFVKLLKLGLKSLLAGNLVRKT